MLYHLYDDSIRIAVWHETCEGASACHPEPAAVVEDDQVCTALLDELGREPDARALACLASDPVMAEYITIMVINNKTAGEYCVTCVAKPTLDAKAV